MVHTRTLFLSRAETVFWVGMTNGEWRRNDRRAKHQGPATRGRPSHGAANRGDETPTISRRRAAGPVARSSNCARFDDAGLGRSRPNCWNVKRVCKSRSKPADRTGRRTWMWRRRLNSTSRSSTYSTRFGPTATSSGKGRGRWPTGIRLPPSSASKSSV